MFKSLFKKKTKTPPPTKDPIEENQQTHIRLKKGWDEARISAGGKVVDIQEGGRYTRNLLHHIRLHLLLSYQYPRYEYRAANTSRESFKGVGVWVEF
jgi:hypothetical protein